MPPRLALRLLGPMELRRDSAAVVLPRSRKTRALLALLALEPRDHRRVALVDLLWERPDDPRAALRWSLARLRPLVDTADRDRLVGTRETVRLMTDDVAIDVLALRAAAAAAADLPTVALEAAVAGIAGRFLEGTEIPGASGFMAWLTSLRTECLALERQVRLALIARHANDPARQLHHAERLIAHDEFDEAAHAELIEALHRSGRREAAEAAAAGVAALFRREGLAPGDRLAALLRGERAHIRDQAPPVPSGPAPAAAPAGLAMARIAVLPFEPLGATPAYLARGLADGVTDALARFRTLMVSARGLAGPLSQAEVLASPHGPGVDWIVTGAVLAGSGRVRLKARLIEAASGTQRWSGEAETAGDDLFAVEADVAGQIAAALEAQVRGVLMERVAGAPAADAGAYDLLLRAMFHLYGTSADFGTASDHLEAALARDPAFALANALLPWTAFMAGRIRDAEAAARFAALSHRAAQAAPEEAFVLALAGTMITVLEHRFETGLALCDRAIAVNPNSVYGWVCRGWVRTYAGDFAGPMADFARADALNFWPTQDYNVGAGRALCCFQQGQLEDAVAWADSGLARVPRNSDALRFKAAALAELGRLEAARATAAQLLEVAPGERAGPVAAALPLRNRETARRLAAALTAAGVPA